MLHYEAEKMGVMYDVRSVGVFVGELGGDSENLCFIHVTVPLMGNWLVSQVWHLTKNITQTADINFVCVLNFRMWQMHKGRKARCWWESKSDHQIISRENNHFEHRLGMLEMSISNDMFWARGRFPYKKYGAVRRNFWKGSCLLDISWNFFHP